MSTALSTSTTGEAADATAGHRSKGSAVVGVGLTKVYGLADKVAKRALQSADPAEAVATAGGFLGAYDVNFEIGTGEMFVIMGLSGSGKSTVLRMINRLNEPTSGQLLINSEDVLQVSEARLRSIRNHTIGMVFQHFSLFPHRSVRDNAAYGLKVRGMTKPEREQRAEAALERVGLKGRGDKFPHELSGGMRQRVGLARALAVDPPILLMDEPFSALDPLIRRDMQDLLVQLQKEDQRTTIFVTHDLNEAMRIGDRVMVMRNGRVIQCGPGTEIIARPADDYVTEFVSDVDRAKVLTAADLMRPALLTLSVTDSPVAALERLASVEANGAFVLGEDGRLMGVVTDTELHLAIADGQPDLRRGLTSAYDAVATDTLVADFMHLAGTRVVPVTVVDPEGRLAGVVPRAAILSSLSRVSSAARAQKELAHA